MAYEGEGFDLTFEAHEDLSDIQYHFVTLQDNDSVRMLDSNAEFPVGILQNNPESGEEAVVRVAGISKLVAGSGGLSRNDKVVPEYIGASDNGKGISGDADGDAVRAVCLFAAGSEDDVATVLLTIDKQSVPAT